jgi:hypothetical protein
MELIIEIVLILVIATYGYKLPIFKKKKEVKLEANVNSYREYTGKLKDPLDDILNMDWEYKGRD